MRILTSLLIVLCALSAFCQRVSFEDPGLTFSFKKPRDWVMVDDGYEIRVSPFMRDTAHTFLTMTYFDYPEPISNDVGTHFSVITIESDTKEQFKDHMWSDEHLVIHGKKVLLKKRLITSNDLLLEQRFYDFDFQQKNWEMVTSVPSEDFKKYQRKFERILRSFRIENQSGY